MKVWSYHRPSFGFVSTRFAGTDGVSLEAKKWAEVVESKDCKAYFMAGKLDTDPAISHLAPKAFFQHPEIEEIQNELFVKKERSRALSSRVHELKEELKDELEEFQRQFEFDILVVENASAIPVNIPLGLAISEFIIENGVPTIAHHHDFYWERQRFFSAAATDYIRRAFPSVGHNIQHVVINSLAGEELGRRTGVDWCLIPNVLDFKNLPDGFDDYNSDFRETIGLDEDTLLVLQPTRVVSRKGIETSIELVRRLRHPKCALVITHSAGDEGYAYQKRIEEYAEFMEVDLRIVSDYVDDKRRITSDGHKVYTVWDVYPHADLVTYPSLYEGYGNAFVEAVYFRKPVIVNRYLIFEIDIEPKGFDVIAFSEFLTDEVLDEVREIIDDPVRREQMAEHNYMLGWRHLSYEVLEEKLETLLLNIYGS